MTTKPRGALSRLPSQLGVPGTSMPPWGKALNDDQINGVLDYVFGATFVARSRAASSSRASVPDAESSRRCRPESAARGEADLHAALHRLPRHARRTARDPTRSTFRRVRATCATPHSSTTSPTAASSSPFSTAWRARPCLRGSTTASQKNDVGDIVNYIRSLNRAAQSGSETASGYRSRRLEWQLAQSVVRGRCPAPARMSMSDTTVKWFAAQLGQLLLRSSASLR